MICLGFKYEIGQNVYYVDRHEKPATIWYHSRFLTPTVNIDIGDSGLEIVQGYSQKMDEDTYLEEISLPGYF